MPNKFFIKTTLEWASTSMNSYIIPRGDLCIETFDDGDMKLKIGDGLRVFKQLPYICHGHDDEKYDYYTKEEIDKMFDDITIDLDNYYNKIEIDEFMTSLRSDLIQYIDNNTHYHHNKAILDQITAPFTREEKEKLANIIDVSGYAERIEVLESIAHTHDNKNVLDLITIEEVNNWHVHSNKSILDNTTASFTVNYKNILDNLVTYNVFEPASAYESGSVGLVPAPNVGDHIKFLRGDGKWVSIEATTIPIATTETLGGIIVGDGLSITQEGVLSADVQQNGVISIEQDELDPSTLHIEYVDSTVDITIPTGSGSDIQYMPGTGINFANREIIDGEYERLSYIESDGTQYIDTGYYHQPDDWYCLNCTFITGDNQTNEAAINANDWDDSVQSNMITLWSRMGGNTVYYSLNDTGTQSDVSYTGSDVYDTRLDVYLFRNRVNIHDGSTGTLLHTLTNSNKSLLSITGHPSLTLMGRHWYYTIDDTHHYDSFAKMRIYGFRIWSDYEHSKPEYGATDDYLVANYFPVKRISDGAIGLYDIISKTFKTSMVGNQFTYETYSFGDAKIIENTGVLDVTLNPEDTSQLVVSKASGDTIIDLNISGGDEYHSGVATEIRSGTIEEWPDIPDTYQYVEYIESDGTQYIDTGYIHQAGNCFYIDVTLLTDDTLAATQQVVFGAFTVEGTSYQKNQVSWYMNDKNIYQYTLGIAPNGSASYAYNSGIYDVRVEGYLFNHNLHVYEHDNKSAGPQVTMSVSNSVSDGANTMAIFCKHVDSSYEAKAKMRLYKFAIYSQLDESDAYNDDYLIKSYYPVYRKSDGAIGLFETISQTFVTSPVGNSFIKGADVYPDTYKFIDVRYSTGLDVNDNNQLINTGILDIEQHPTKSSRLIVTTKDGQTNINLPEYPTYQAGENITITEVGTETLRIPRQYQEVEYIAGDPSLCTRYAPTTNTKIVFDGVLNTTTTTYYDGIAVMGSLESNWYNSWYFTQYNEGYLIRSGVLSNKLMMTTGVRFTATFTGSTGTAVYTNGTTQTWSTGSASNNTAPMGIMCFCNEGVDNKSWKCIDSVLYSAQIYEGDTQVREYIPCYRIEDGQAGFYETFTDTFIPSVETDVPIITGPIVGIDVSQLGNLYEISANLEPATTTTIGGIIVGDGLSVDEDGVLSASYGEGIIYYPGEAIDIIREGISDEYQEVEYIETYNGGISGFSYIDTNYIPGPNTDIELILTPVSGSQTFTPIAISRYDNTSYTVNVFGLAWNSSTGNGVWFNRADQTSNFGGQYVELSDTITNKKTKFKTVGNTLSVYDENDNLLGSVTDESSFTANASYTLPIFVSKLHSNDVYSSDYMYGKFYEMYIRENNIIVHHFIPCKTADTTSSVVIGVYDTIGRRFYQISAYGGGGSVRVGPDVSGRTFETKINVLYDDGLDVNDDNELINTGVLDVNINAQDSSKLDIEFHDHTKTIAIYELPPATTEVLGGIIVGNGLSITSEGVLSADAITIDDYVISVTQDEEFLNILHVEYPDGTVDITLPQNEGQVEVDEPEEELIISGSYSPGGELYKAGTGISITKASGDDRHLPDAYKQIQYIESNEFTQFLDTEILVIPGIKIECDCEVSDAIKDSYQAIFGTKYANNYDCFIFWTRFNSQNIPCFASPSSGEVTGSGFIYNTRIKIVATQSGASWYVNDSLVGSINGSGNWSYDKPIILFGCAKEGNVESGCKGKCYEFKAYNGDTLTNDLIPCVEIATGEVGMYDLIANKFCKAVDDGVTREPFVAGPDLIADNYITNTGVLDIAVNEEDETVLDVTFYNQTKHIQMSGGSSYDDTELRSLITALTTQVQSLQTELNTLKSQAVLSDDIRYIDKVTVNEYTSMVRSNDTMYLINDESGELEPTSSVVPTDTLSTSMDNVDIMIIGDLEEVE